MALAAWFGISDPCGRTAPVFGDVRLFANQLSISTRSYVWPSAAMTGSRMISIEMGQHSASGTSPVRRAIIARTYYVTYSLFSKVSSCQMDLVIRLQAGESIAKSPSV